MPGETLMSEPFEPHDLLKHQAVTDIDCAYEKDLACCAVTRVDAANDDTTSALWMLPLEDGPPWQLTAGVSTDVNPRWSPDAPEPDADAPRLASKQPYKADGVEFILDRPV